ncbi:MAG: hypothetical protein R3E76_11120 [Planctomycetota bacterium]
MRYLCLVCVLSLAGCVAHAPEGPGAPKISKYVSSPGATDEQVADWRKGQTPEASLRALFHAVYNSDREAAAAMTVTGGMDAIEELIECIGLRYLSSEKLDFIIDTVSVSKDTARILCHIGSHGGGLSLDWAKDLADDTTVAIHAVRLSGKWRIDVQKICSHFPRIQDPNPSPVAPFPALADTPSTREDASVPAELAPEAD